MSSQPYNEQITIVSISTPVTDGNNLDITVVFTTTYASFSSQDNADACFYFDTAVSNVFGISFSRLTCSITSFGTGKKRQTNTGNALIVVAQPPVINNDASSGSSSTNLGLILGIIFASILLILLIAAIIAIVVRNRERQMTWTKY